MDGNISGDDQVGGIVGMGSGFELTNCYAGGLVNGGNTNIGGLFGVGSECLLSNCYAVNRVTGSQNVGAIIGRS
jgi:hypothetical protein